METGLEFPGDITEKGKETERDFREVFGFGH